MANHNFVIGTPLHVGVRKESQTVDIAFSECAKLIQDYEQAIARMKHNRDLLREIAEHLNKEDLIVNFTAYSMRFQNRHNDDVHFWVSREKEGKGYWIEQYHCNDIPQYTSNLDFEQATDMTVMLVRVEPTTDEDDE